MRGVRVVTTPFQGTSPIIRDDLGIIVCRFLHMAMDERGTLLCLDFSGRFLSMTREVASDKLLPSKKIASLVL